MSDGITYCSAFPEDAVFGAIMNSFQFRWTGSCIANPEYEPEDMLKAVVHALASSKSSETSFLVVLTLLVWDDTDGTLPPYETIETCQPSFVSPLGTFGVC